jgi:hypothetical protein
MPPHCDSLDGPVVTAAARALQAGNVELILPYVHPDGEAEVRQAFARVLPLQAGGDGMGELADRWFSETVVRVHRAGEGAPYTGLKPAGLDPGPVLPLAEQAVATGDVQPVYELLAAELRTSWRVGWAGSASWRRPKTGRWSTPAPGSRRCSGSRSTPTTPTPRFSTGHTASTTTADRPLRRLDDAWIRRRATGQGWRVLQSGARARIISLAILAPMRPGQRTQDGTDGGNDDQGAASRPDRVDGWCPPRRPTSPSPADPDTQVVELADLHAEVQRFVQQ